jgi:hypothetical protein
MNNHVEWYVTECGKVDCWCRCIFTQPDSDDLEHCIAPADALSKEDAERIVAEHNERPKLLAEIERLKAKLEKAEKAVAARDELLAKAPCPSKLDKDGDFVDRWVAWLELAEEAAKQVPDPTDDPRLRAIQARMDATDRLATLRKERIASLQRRIRELTTAARTATESKP